MRAVIAILFVISSSALAQDFNNIKEQEPVKLNGSINATTLGYYAQGIEGRRAPFDWFLNGSLSLNLYGWSIPVSFSYSNKSYQYSQPFNRYGATPEYKWIKAYIGYNSMNFSRYSLSGYIFMGGGVELTPGKFKINAMYGRLNEAIQGDSINLSTFKRMGAGLKVGYADKGDEISLSVFNAWDDPGSIEAITENPQENLVISINGRKRITKRINLSLEYATSALTRDLTSEGEAISDGFFNFHDQVLETNSTTEYYQAFNTMLSYNAEAFSLNAGFERVDPGYTTLGAYFFNNDLQNITVGGSFKLLEQKVNITINGGLQHNNLDDTEMSKTERVISNIAINYVPDKNWNVSTSFSNFTTHTNIRPRLNQFFQEDLDTLNFYQINKNATVTVGYTFSDGANPSSLFLTSTYQGMTEEQNDQDVKSSFINANLAYRIMIRETSFSMAVNYNQNNFTMMSSNTYGPVLSANRMLFDKKLRVGLAGSFNQVVDNGVTTSKMMNYRLNGTYKLRKKHRLTFFINMLRKFADESSISQFNEFTAQLRYGYAF